MATSIVSLCNQALYSVGCENPIASLDEGSAESKILSACYELVRDSLLRSFPWAFALRVDALESPSDESHPEWQYVYTYPANCLRVMRVFGKDAMTTTGDDDVSVFYGRPRGPLNWPEHPEKFVVGGTSDGRRIYTNQNDAYAEFIYQETDPMVWDPLFQRAFVAQLAAEICLGVTGSDGKYADAVRRARQAYNAAISASAVERRNTDRRRYRYKRAR